MGKKIISTFLFIICTFSAFAYGFIYDGIKYGTYELNTNNVQVVGLYNYPESYSGGINIPSTVKDYDGKIYHVKRIGYYAFAHYSNLTSVSIPSSVNYISDGAFSGCSSLTSIVLPANITYIGSAAFNSCHSLKTINIPNTVTTIGDWTFQECNSLESITIPNSVISIGEYAFYNCYNLFSVSISNSVTSIGHSAFKKCAKLTSVTLPGSITMIDSNTFSGCSHLASIIIPNSVKEIGSGVFSECSSLTSINIPGSVTNIGDSFSGCSSLNKVVFEDGNEMLYIGVRGRALFRDCPLEELYLGRDLSYYDYSPFQDKTSLYSVIISNTVTLIQFETFRGCKGMTSIIIPNSVTLVRYGAFDGCTGIIKAVFEDGEKILEFDSCYGLFQDSKIKELYLGRNTSYYLENSPFRNQMYLSSVTIGNLVTQIGISAFAQCSNIANVYSLNITPPTIDVTTFDNKIYSKALLHVPNGSINNYKQHSIWKNFFNINEDIENSGVISGVELSENDFVEIYELNGVLVFSGSYAEANLSRGIYIVRRELNIEKIFVK